MMNDIYLEYILKKKKTGGQKAIIAVIIFAAIIVSVALLLLIFATATALSGTQFGSFSFSIGLVLIAFAWYGAYLLMSMQNIEYEYILTNSEIDIDKIMSKKARKRIARFDCGRAERVLQTFVCGGAFNFYIVAAAFSCEHFNSH